MARAIAAFIAITTRDVPIACFAGNFNSRVSAGTTANPPPTPNRPVRRPTSVAAPASFARAGAERSRPAVGTVRSRVATPTGARDTAPGAPAPRSRASGPPTRPGPSGPSTPSGRDAVATWTVADAGADDSTLRYMRTATNTIRAEKARRRTFSSSERLTTRPIRDPTMPAAPKASPAPRRTLPWRRWPTTPIAAAVPTTRSDAEVASWAVSPATNTRIGTASVEPPPPSAPSERPTSRPRAIATISHVMSSLRSRPCPQMYGHLFRTSTPIRRGADRPHPGRRFTGPTRRCR